MIVIPVEGVNEKNEIVFESFDIYILNKPNRNGENVLFIYNVLKIYFSYTFSLTSEYL